MLTDGVTYLVQNQWNFIVKIPYKIQLKIEICAFQQMNLHK